MTARNARRGPGSRIPEPEGRLRAYPKVRTETLVEYRNLRIRGILHSVRHRAIWVRRSYTEPCTACGEEIRWFQWRPTGAGRPRSARRFLTCARCAFSHFLRLRVRGAQVC